MIDAAAWTGTFETASASSWIEIANSSATSCVRGPVPFKATAVSSWDENDAIARQLPHDSSAELVEVLLEGLPGVQDVEVTRTIATVAGGYVWHVAMVDVDADTSGRIPAIECNSSLLSSPSTSEPTSCEVTLEVQNNVVGGNFFLRLGPLSTASLPWNATAEDVEGELNQLYLPGVADAVAVTRSNPSP